MDRQNEKEKSVQLTEKLDADWKELQGLVASSSKKANESNTIPRQKADAYDLMIHELKYERKTTPSDRMKTEDEIAKDEKERLEKLEADRVRRMNGIEPAVEAISHKSADDLDDGYIVDKKSKTVRFALSYNEGQLIQRNQSENEEKLGGDDDNADDDDDSDSDVAEDDADDIDVGTDEDGEQSDDNLSDDELETIENSKDNSCDIEETTCGDKSSGEDESDDAMEHTSDLESDEDSEDVSSESSNLLPHKCSVFWETFFLNQMFPRVPLNSGKNKLFKSVRLYSIFC